MKKSVLLLLLLCLPAALAIETAEAGQYRIAPPAGMRKRQPPRDYRESRLEIINDDNRGYAIDVDYRRNSLTFVHRSRGDIFVPGNSSVTLIFDDDDNWRFYGDYEVLDIEIRSGRTSRLRLETRANRNQIALFGTVEIGGRRYSKQLFHYADRPGPSRPPVVVQPGRPPVVVQPGRPTPGSPVVVLPSHPGQRPPPPAPIRPMPRADVPSTGAVLGSVVGGIVGGLIDNNRDRDRDGPRR